jgi:carbonic anhydrase
MEIQGAHMKRILLYRAFHFCVAFIFFVIVGLASHTAAQPQTKTMTKEKQEVMTAQKALDKLKKGNKRFLEAKMKERNLYEQMLKTSVGQYPFASIVACLDSRSGPEYIFDQGIGDFFVARVAGNFVNDDILGSLEFASKIMGSKLIVVLGHTSCGAVKAACDNVQLGNITSVVNAIRPAVEAVPNDGSDRSSKNEVFVEKAADENIRHTIKEIFTRSPILKEMDEKGEIEIVGAKLDIQTGKVTWFE